MQSVRMAVRCRCRPLLSGGAPGRSVLAEAQKHANRRMSQVPRPTKGKDAVKSARNWRNLSREGVAALIRHCSATNALDCLPLARNRSLLRKLRVFLDGDRVFDERGRTLFFGRAGFVWAVVAVQRHPSRPDHHRRTLEEIQHVQFDLFLHQPAGNRAKVVRQLVVRKLVAAESRFATPKPRNSRNPRFHVSVERPAFTRADSGKVRSGNSRF